MEQSKTAPGTAAPGLTPAAALAALPLEVAALHVGTLGLVLEPMAGALEDMDLAREMAQLLVAKSLTLKASRMPGETVPSVAFSMPMACLMSTAAGGSPTPCSRSRARRRPAPTPARA